MEKLVCVKDFQEAAFRILDNNTIQYYKSGADEEITLRDNQEAFKRWAIRPRMLRDVSKRTLRRDIMGKPVCFPVGVAPTAMQRLAHAEGECANAKAAAEMGTIFILSTIATSSIEQIAEAAPNGRRWFQLYIYKDRRAVKNPRNITLNLIRRAEANGFEAIALTVDTPYFGKRRSNVRDRFHLPKHLRLANFEFGTQNSEATRKLPEGSAMQGLDQLLDQSLTWDDVKWLKSVTKLKVILKGILIPEDAEEAVKIGVDAIIVSNHGARQLDTVYPTIDALPGIVKQVAGRCEVYLDGGVSTGTDVFKALALGAGMVFLGRPLLWGLAVGGQTGAKKVLQILKDELDLTMALTGLAHVNEISNDHVGRHLQSKL